MQVSELISMLEDMEPDAEVRLAIQPNYPFQHSIDTVVCTTDFLNVAGADCEDCGGVVGLEESTDDADACDCTEPPEAAPIVYIAEAGQYSSAPYLPGAVARELGWK